VGVIISAGNIIKALNEIEISCLPKDLPEYLEVDMEEIDLGDSVHLTDITLPEGVTSVALVQNADNDMTVASVAAPKAIEEEVEEEEEEDLEGLEEGEEGEEGEAGEGDADAEDKSGDDK